MNTEDKKLSFERLDETKPERNKRSFFDWLTGKEATPEEELREKLDKELKDAARKRAEEEEQRRAAEVHEEAETRKLKKRWRKNLFEKSKRQLEELKQDEEEPLDGYRLAQFMVAEKIVELTKVLEEEDLRRSEIKTLKIHIDFMGLLSEKLSNPELEMPKEVEEVYATILEVSSADEPRPEAPTYGDDSQPVSESAEAAPAPTRLTPETPEAHTSDTEAEEKALFYGPAVAGIVVALKRVIRGERVKQQQSETTTSLYGTPVGQPDSYSTLPAPEDVAPKPAPVTRLREVIQDIAAPASTIREEFRHTRSLEHLASAVAAADSLRAAGKLETLTPPMVATGIVSSAERVERAVQTPVVAPALDRRPVSLERTAPERELEELSTSELLVLATTIDLGAGRYLKYEFEGGRIDRDGMIKVIKAHRKGLDYRTEFDTRSRAWQLTRAESPEFSRHAPQQTPPTSSPYPELTDEQVEKAKRAIPDPPAMITSPKQLLTEARALVRSTAATIRRHAGPRWLLYASVALVIVVGAILLTLFTL